MGIKKGSYSCECFRTMFLCCIYLLMLLVISSVCVHGKTPSSEGFLNIDCGLESNTSYIDGTTGLKYVSDDQYIGDIGVKGNVSTQYRRDLDAFRIFPNNTRSCYPLTPVEAYVKEHIRPLCKSGVITVRQHRWAVGKTVEKVIKYHQKDKNANFLIKESDKVKKLAEKYVEATQNMADV